MSMLQAKVPDRRVFNVFPQSLAPYMIEATSVSMGNVEAMSFARWLTEEGFACVSDHDFILPSGQRTPWRFNWVGEVCPVGSAAARMKQCVRNYLNPLRKLPAPVRRYKGVDAASPRLRVLFQQQSQSECQAEQQHMAFDGVIGEGELGLLPTLEAAAVTKPERSQRSRASDQGPDSDGVDSPTQEELTHEQQEKQDMVACFLDVSCLEAMLEALEACEAKAAEGGAGGDIEDVESELHLLSCMMEGCIVTRSAVRECATIPPPDEIARLFRRAKQGDATAQSLLKPIVWRFTDDVFPQVVEQIVKSPLGKRVNEVLHPALEMHVKRMKAESRKPFASPFRRMSSRAATAGFIQPKVPVPKMRVLSEPLS